MSKGVANASLAGICAAFAGITAKFALAPENPQGIIRFCDHYIPSEYVIPVFPKHTIDLLHDFFLQTSWIVRGIFAIATVMFNSLMLTLTAKAMQLCPTTVVSVVTSSAANFLFTVGST